MGPILRVANGQVTDLCRRWLERIELLALDYTSSKIELYKPVSRISVGIVPIAMSLGAR